MYIANWLGAIIVLAYIILFIIIINSCRNSIHGVVGDGLAHGIAAAAAIPAPPQPHQAAAAERHSRSLTSICSFTHPEQQHCVCIAGTNTDKYHIQTILLFEKTQYYLHRVNNTITSPVRNELQKQHVILRCSVYTTMYFTMSRQNVRSECNKIMHLEQMY